MHSFFDDNSDTTSHTKEIKVAFDEASANALAHS
jgi:hypothetical protein